MLSKKRFRSHTILDVCPVHSSKLVERDNEVVFMTFDNSDFVLESSNVGANVPAVLCGSFLADNPQFVVRAHYDLTPNHVIYDGVKNFKRIDLSNLNNNNE